MTNFSKEFYCLLNFIGWGDPKGGLWTFGVEEAGEWCIGSQKIKEKFEEICGKDPTNNWDISYIKKCIQKNFCNDFNYVAIHENKQGHIANISAKIGCALSESFNELPWEKYWRKYRDCKLWIEKSKIFNGNLFPLGKKSLQTSFPECYKELFGISPETLDKYEKEVRSKRFKKIRFLYKRYSPKAIICYGKNYISDFINTFEFEIEKEEGEILICNRKRIIITPHFSYRKFSDDLVKKLVSILKSWKISLP